MDFIGKDKIDLKRAVEILVKEFNVKRFAIVGGPLINSLFLDEGLLDEISVVVKTFKMELFG